MPLISQRYVLCYSFINFTHFFACFKNSVIHILLRYGFLQIPKVLRDCHPVLLHPNQTCTCAGYGGTLKRFVSPNHILILGFYISTCEISDTSFCFFSLLPQDLKKKPRYLVTFTVGYKQRQNIDACVKKVASCPFCFLFLS